MSTHKYKVDWVLCMQHLPDPPKTKRQAEQRIIEMYRTGWSIQNLADALLVDTTTIRRVLLLNGEPIRGRGGRNYQVRCHIPPREFETTPMTQLAKKYELTYNQVINIKRNYKKEGVL